MSYIHPMGGLFDGIRQGLKPIAAAVSKSPPPTAAPETPPTTSPAPTPKPPTAPGTPAPVQQDNSTRNYLILAGGVAFAAYWLLFRKREP